MTNPPDAPLAVRSLFGGAITMALPSDYLDASDLRQIPDNQEVFLSSTSETSMVVEVLDMVEEGQCSTDLWEAAKFHFSSLAHDNTALSSTVLASPPSSPLSCAPQRTSPRTPRPIVLTGLQRIHKFTHDPSGAPRAGHEGDTPDEVWIGVALWRCWLEPAPQTGDASRKKADVVCSVNVNLSAADGTGQAEREKVERWWSRAVQGLRIEDWGLFGDAV